MNRLQIFLIFILLLIIIIRITLQGGLEQNEQFELENKTEYLNESREYLQRQFSLLLPKPQSSLLSGMVLGIKSDLPFEFTQALRNTATLHLVVVSGQNLTILSGLILSLSFLLGRKKTVFLTLITVFFYTLLTGLGVPVVRAFLMVSFLLIADVFGREGDSIFILTFTAMLMLVFNPGWIYSISFQLSFLATIGVLIIAPVVISKVKFVPDIIKQDLVVTICAQLLTFPIIAANFHQASVVGVIVNLLVLWTVPFVMVFGVITLFISLVSFNLAKIFSIVPLILTTYFVDVVNFFNHPGVALYVPKINFIVWIGYYLVIIGVYLFLTKKEKNIP